MRTFHGRMVILATGLSLAAGLVPLAALVDVADHADVASDLPVEQRITDAAAWLKARDFEPTMALELRLAAARAGQEP